MCYIYPVIEYNYNAQVYIVYKFSSNLEINQLNNVCVLQFLHDLYLS